MSPVFVDSGFHQAILHRRDENHDAAVRILQTCRGPFVTTDWVLVELLNSFSRGESNRRDVAALVEGLYNDPAVNVVPATHRDFRRGIEAFRARGDKGWSIVDCISFLVMRDRRLTVALTFDIHFEQAGFERVMQPAPRERRGKNL